MCAGAPPTLLKVPVGCIGGGNPELACDGDLANHDELTFALEGRDDAGVDESLPVLPKRGTLPADGPAEEDALPAPTVDAVTLVALFAGVLVGAFFFANLEAAAARIAPGGPSSPSESDSYASLPIVRFRGDRKR
jgi:hypothetical protein